MTTATEVKEDVILNQKEWEIPSAEVHALELIDVVDLGKQKTLHGEKPKLNFVYLVLDEKGKSGDDLKVYQRFTATPHVKGSLAIFLLQLGIDLSQAKSFNVTKLKGTKFSAVIEHNKSKTDPSKVFANIGSVLFKTVKLAPALTTAMTTEI